MKAEETYAVSTPGDPHTDGRKYKLVREVPHPVDPSIKCWMTTDVATGADHIWPTAVFTEAKPDK